MTLKSTLLILFSFVCVPVFAQAQPANKGANYPGNMYGKILQGQDARPIEAASVQFILTPADSLVFKKAGNILATVLSNKKGEFNVEGLPLTGKLHIQVTAIGYKYYEATVSFQGAISGILKDLGNIKLQVDEQQLDNIVVNSVKPLLELYLDKKVYNVEKDLSVAGGTAVDVMKNVPSVSVDIDGNVTMRNASPQIFIDGRPTALSLEQIPADQIASVEILSNPSAKFDASGGGAGILNIVLKKNRKAGYNGNLRASMDSRGRPGFGGDINLKQQKLNFFASGQVFYRKNLSTVRSNRQEILNNGLVNIMQANAPVLKGVFGFGRAGFDYLLANRTTLSLSGNAFKGKLKVNDLLDISRDSLTSMVTSSETVQRNVKADIDFKNAGVVMGIKHNFARVGREFTADVNYSQSENGNLSDYQSAYFDNNGNSKPLVGAERSVGGATTKFYTFQTDFVTPLTKTSKIEMGGRMATRDYQSWNQNFLQNLNSGNYVIIPAITVDFTFKDVVYAAYGNFSQQLKSLNFQLGLRLESSQYEGNLLNNNQKFKNEFPMSAFPSLFVSKTLNKKQELQLNYSRKINRPGFFQILPFVDFSDSLNIAIGNPNLLPEFTNLVEFNFSNNYKPGHSLLASLYGKYTDGLVTRYQYKAPNTDPSRPDSVIYNSYANANKSYTVGLELTAKNQVAKWWDITSNLNFFDVTLQADNIAAAGNSRRFSWFAKLNNNFKFSKTFSMQVNADYQSKTILPAGSGRGGGGGLYAPTQNLSQGVIQPIYGLDISFRKDFLKNNAASLSLLISDVFRSRAFETTASTSFFIQDNYRLRDPQLVRLSFNWRFGKFDVALFKKKNTRMETENVPGM